MHKINTRQSLAHEVAEGWKSQYQRDDGDWETTKSGSAKATYNKLVEAHGDPDLIDGIIGHNGWTRMWCKACGDYRDPTFTFREGDDELSSVTLCYYCLRAALDDYRGEP